MSANNEPSGFQATPTTIDRCAHRRGDDEWLESQWASPKTRVLVVSGGEALLATGGAERSPQLLWQAPDAVEADSEDRFLLGVDSSGRACFAVPAATLPDGQSGGLRQLLPVLSPGDSALLLHAVGLCNWHAAHPRCSRCGGPTSAAMSGAERRCPADGSTHFPRTDPAIIVLVTDPEDRALLGRQQSWPRGRFSTLAGFVEPGESAEQAVTREVAEESGIAVNSIQYVCSQPWPFPASLMLGFFAASPGGEPVADGDELAEVRWFSRDQVTADISSGALVPPGTISVARLLVERWYGQPLPDGPPGSSWR